MTIMPTSITVQPFPLDAPTRAFPAVGQFVMEEIVRTTTTHSSSSEKHILKLYAMEIGFVTEKIVIETVSGATAYDYLGPLESIIA
jgi:hypothetical protein